MIKKDTYLYSEQEIRLSNDSAFVQNEENDVPDYDFDLVTDGPVTVEIPRIYYVGYTISLDNEEVPYHESENGLIEFELFSFRSRRSSLYWYFGISNFS